MKKKKWKPKIGGSYYFINHCSNVRRWKNTGFFIDKLMIARGNCFKTKKEAEAVAKKIRKILMEG